MLFKIGLCFLFGQNFPANGMIIGDIERLSSLRLELNL